MSGRSDKQKQKEKDYTDKVAYLGEVVKERLAFLSTFTLPGLSLESLEQEIQGLSGGNSSSDGAAGQIPGDGNEEKAWNFFAQNGFSAAATAGILGNLKQESGIDPTKKQYGGGPGRGIAQWESSSGGSGRWDLLVKYAKKKGKSEWDIDIQLEWLLKELDEGTCKSILDKRFGGLDAFKKMSDPKKAADAFEQSFERAGKPNMSNRYKYAQEYYDKWGKNGPASGATGTAKKVIDLAEQWLHKPNKYVFGAGRSQADIEAGRFDCSSFCRYIFSQAGYDIFGNGSLSGNTDTVIKNKDLKVITTSQLKPGDLVFFDTYKQYGHITIYLGNQKCIGTQSSHGVAIVDMTSSYWKPKISDTHRRVL